MSRRQHGKLERLRSYEYPPLITNLVYPFKETVATSHMRINTRGLSCKCQVKIELYHKRKLMDAGNLIHHVLRFCKHTRSKCTDYQGVYICTPNASSWKYNIHTYHSTIPTLPVHIRMYVAALMLWYLQ